MCEQGSVAAPSIIAGKGDRNSLVAFKRAGKLGNDDSTKSKTNAAAASAMQDAAAATMKSATTVLAVLELIMPLCQAFITGWQKGEQMQRLESFISACSGVSGFESEKTGSVSSSGQQQQSISSHESKLDSQVNAKDSVTAPDSVDLRERPRQSGLRFSEASMRHGASSSSSQNEVTFHGWRDSLTEGSTQIDSRSTAYRTNQSSAAGSHLETGMSRITRMRLMRTILKGGTIKLLCVLASMGHVSAPYHASIQQRAAAMLKTWAVHAPDIAAELVASQYLICRFLLTHKDV